MAMVLDHRLHSVQRVQREKDACYAFSAAQLSQHHPSRDDCALLATPHEHIFLKGKDTGTSSKSVCIPKGSCIIQLRRVTQS